jgi:hypothetical protein
MIKVKNLASAILDGIENIIFDGPYTSKVLPGYVDGTYVYVKLNEAQEACKARNDCSGVTQGAPYFTLRQGLNLINSLPGVEGETSWLKNVSFSGPHTNKSIAGYASASGTNNLHATVNQAQEACKARNDCSGVTQESIYTLRTGLGLVTSSLSHEISWVKSDIIRKIRVEHPVLRNNFGVIQIRPPLNIREVQVFDYNGINVALNKTASQSSIDTLDIFAFASKAVNGDVNDVGSKTSSMPGK